MRKNKSGRGPKLTRPNFSFGHPGSSCKISDQFVWNFPRYGCWKVPRLSNKIDTWFGKKSKNLFPVNIFLQKFAKNLEIDRGTKRWKLGAIRVLVLEIFEVKVRLAGNAHKAFLTLIYNEITNRSGHILVKINE